MYETFFGLKRSPFLFAPDVESYFSIGYMEESRHIVEHTVRKGEGISLIFGAEGTGKTLLLRLLRQSLESEYAVALVSNSRLTTSKALFLQLAYDLRLSCSGSETVELRLQILDFSRRKSSRGIVLLFDEAQHLSPSVLEEIRLLTEPADDSVPLFRAIFAGTPDFEEKLTLPNLEAFNQRITSRCYLDSFSGEETSRYIAWQTDDQRLDASIPLFTETAKQRIYQLTGGTPRLINQLCGTSLQFATDKEMENIDEALVNAAWANLQHIEPVEPEQVGFSAVRESSISPEQIEEIIDQKRKTFHIRHFDPIEFGTLTDCEPEPTGTPRTFHGNDYKPPFPDDDDDELIASESEVANEVAPPCRRLQLCVPAESRATDPEPVTQMPVAQRAKAILAQRKIVPDFFGQERQFRRRCLLERIRHRLGLFAGVLQQTVTHQSEPSFIESGMNTQSLQEYGAAVLDGRPLFIRKEPHYAYQTPEVPPQNDITYPDMKTGVPITLRWLPEQSGESERFGVSYTEFLNREKSQEYCEPKEQTVLPKPELAVASIVRTSLNASLGRQVALSHCSGLEETFVETQKVGDLAISLAELFRAQSSAMQQVEESPEFKRLDNVVQNQLEAVVQRIIKAAEKIEQAAETSERAGRHVSQAAEFVETEVKSALPTYTELFRQWSEFQELISTELESLQQKNSETPKFRTLPRRQVVIERVVPTIDVETLLR